MLITLNKHHYISFSVGKTSRESSAETIRPDLSGNSSAHTLPSPANTSGHPVKSQAVTAAGYPLRGPLVNGHLQRSEKSLSAAANGNPLYAMLSSGGRVDDLYSQVKLVLVIHIE